MNIVITKHTLCSFAYLLLSSLDTLPSAHLVFCYIPLPSHIGALHCAESFNCQGQDTAAKDLDSQSSSILGMPYHI